MNYTQLWIGNKLMDSSIIYKETVMKPQLQRLAFLHLASAKVRPLLVLHAWSHLSLPRQTILPRVGCAHNPKTIGDAK